MGSFREVMQFRRRCRRRAGFTLVELIVVMFVMIILIGISVAAMASARDRANETSTLSDLKSFGDAVRQALMEHPEVMTYRSAKPAGACKKIVGYINDQFDDQWGFTIIDADGESKSGGVGYTTIKRDAWGNAYSLYIYLDDHDTSYCDRDGVQQTVSNSCVYVVIASPGKNSTGVGQGYDGSNYSEGTYNLTAANAMVNNTDGVDDLGVICRIKDGEIQVAQFGTDGATLGRLKGVQWVFGVADAGRGVYHDFKATDQSSANNVTAPAIATSLDQYYNESAITVALDSPTGKVNGTIG